MEVNEIVDKIIENLETSLGKLGRSLRISEKKEEEEKQDLENKKEEFIIKRKEPFVSVKYPLQDNILEDEKLNTFENITNNHKTAVQEAQNDSILTNDSSPKTNLQLEISKSEQVDEIKEKNEKISENKLIKIDAISDTEGDSFFLDIKKEIRLIHLFGPPGSAKTTIGIQTAIEVTPRNTYYFITSHATSVIKRLKQIIENERWSDYKTIKKTFFPIEISNLEVLENQLMKIEEMNSEEVGLIIIDHITDYSRGQIHKEEKRKQLRELLERLYLLADAKHCKIIIINGYSFKDSAPAEDIVESFCDMTLQTIIEDYQVKLIIDKNEFPLQLDDSGVMNLFINVYY